MLFRNFLGFVIGFVFIDAFSVDCICRRAAVHSGEASFASGSRQERHPRVDLPGAGEQQCSRGRHRGDSPMTHPLQTFPAS